MFWLLNLLLFSNFLFLLAQSIFFIFLFNWTKQRIFLFFYYKFWLLNFFNLWSNLLRGLWLLLIWCFCFWFKRKILILIIIKKRCLLLLFSFIFALLFSCFWFGLERKIFLLIVIKNWTFLWLLSCKRILFLNLRLYFLYFDFRLLYIFYRTFCFNSFFICCLFLCKNILLLIRISTK